MRAPTIEVKALSLKRCALHKFHVTDSQNTRDHITTDRRLKRAWSNCVMCIPNILSESDSRPRSPSFLGHAVALGTRMSGSQNECRLHTRDACVITTWKLGLRATRGARNNLLSNHVHRFLTRKAALAPMSYSPKELVCAIYHLSIYINFVLINASFNIQFLWLSTYLFTALMEFFFYDMRKAPLPLQLTWNSITQERFLPQSTWKYRCELVLSSRIRLCCDWQRWALLESSYNFLWITRTEKQEIPENI